MASNARWLCSCRPAMSDWQFESNALVCCSCATPSGALFDFSFFQEVLNLERGLTAWLQIHRRSTSTSIWRPAPGTWAVACAGLGVLGKDAWERRRCEFVQEYINWQPLNRQGVQQALKTYIFALFSEKKHPPWWQVNKVDVGIDDAEKVAAGAADCPETHLTFFKQERAFQSVPFCRHVAAE